MRKGLVLLLVTGLLLVGAQSVFAFGPQGLGSESCLVPQQYQEQVKETVELFHEKMAALKERIFALRGTGDIEAIREIHNERLDLMVEKREAISVFIPEELREGYLNWEPGFANRMAREGRRGPWER